MSNTNTAPVQKREKTGCGSSISINGADKATAEEMKAQAQALKEQGQKTSAIKQLEALYQDPAAEKGTFYGYTISHTDDGKITVKSETGEASTVPDGAKVTTFIFDLRAAAQDKVFVPGNGHRAVCREHVEQVKERVENKKNKKKKRKLPATPDQPTDKSRPDALKRRKSPPGAGAGAGATASSVAPLRRSSRRRRCPQ
jgi:hypothetical protein